MNIKKKIVMVSSITIAGSLLLAGCSNIPEEERYEKRFGDVDKNVKIEQETSKSVSDKNSGVENDATEEQKVIHKFVLSYFDEMVNTSAETAKELNRSDAIISEAVGKEWSGKMATGDPTVVIPELPKDKQENLAKAFSNLNKVEKHNAKNITNTSDLALFNMMNVIYNSMFGMIMETGVNTVSFTLPTNAILIEEGSDDRAIIDTTKMTIQSGTATAIVSELSNIPTLPIIKENGKWMIDSAVLLQEYKNLISNIAE